MPLPMFQKKESLPRINCTLAIAAGKGGVGKSTITVQLAFALKLLGYSVGVLDADIYGPSVRKMLPEDRFPSQKGNVIIPALCQGIKMISMAYFRREGEAAVVRAPIANGLISQFLKQVDWGDLDFLLIDFPPGTGDVQLTLSQQANLTAALMVTTPQEVALLDVRKAMHLFHQVHVPVVGIVENMSCYYLADNESPVYIFGKGGGERLAREAGLPLLGKIPLDPHLCHCGDTGQSLFKDASSNPRGAAGTFKDLAKAVVEHIKLLQSQSESCLQQFEISWRDM